MRKRQDVNERFWSKVNRATDAECWTWGGKVARSGYGHFYYLGSVIHAHRVAFILTFGDDIDGLDVDHLCHNPACVNPHHLEAVTHAENMRRTRAALATHCARGHEYGDYRNPSHGRRECAECRRLREVARTARRREQRQIARAS